MGRAPRADKAGGLYHALNRGNARKKIFRKDADYEAFERIVAEGLERFSVELYAYQWMPSHWHMVLSPQLDGEMSRFIGWLTLTHTQRYHAHHGTTGHGHVYQGRYKSFPTQDDIHFLTVCRYVERNAVTAKIAKRAENYRWGSLWNWCGGESAVTMSPWPIRRASNWTARVNMAVTAKERKSLQQSMQRGVPFGDTKWTEKTVKQFGLESTVRPRGRPKKTT